MNSSQSGGAAHVVKKSKFSSASAFTSALLLALGCTAAPGDGGSPGPGSGGVPAGGSSGGNASLTGGTTSAGGSNSGGSIAAGGSGGSGAASTGAQPSSGGSPQSGGTSSGGVGGGTGGTADTVTKTSSTYEFRHFPIETAPSGVWSGGDEAGATSTTTTYNTVVLENGFLKVTLLPDYGGRVLSIIHKPTGRELLYQNPIGTPYLMNEEIFCYDYLVIMGGIFPSFPEPEHGRYWNMPYELEVVSETPEAITVRMTRQDDLDLPAGVPTKYDVGRTDVVVQLDVTLRAGRSNLELSTQLTNPKTTPISKFEYWTVTTLAPGSTPGATKIPENTRILAKMAQVHLLESSWAWFGEAEERVSGEVFKWNNLASFTNWDDQGTGFASPQYATNFSGLINQDEKMGVLRVSENVQTPGLKLWTFGKQSLTADVDDSSQWLRPTIEMWHGVTPEFWNRGTMAAGEVKKWTDNYMPLLGMSDVTAASEFGSVYLSRAVSGQDVALSAVATLSVPGQTVHAVLKLNGTVIQEQDVVAGASEPNVFEVILPATDVTAGATFQAEFTQGDTSLLSGQTTLN